MSEDLSDSENKSLNHEFEKCSRLYKDLKESSEPSRSDKFQAQVRSCISQLEKLTVCVSQADMFSDNESLEELSTPSLKFLLLPFMLAELTVKLAEPDRMQLIARADVYFRDFVQRCNDYSISDISPPPPHDMKTTSNSAKQPADGAAVDGGHQPSMQSLAAMSRQREARISRFKQQKQLQSKLDELQLLMNSGSASEDMARDYYCTMLERSVYTAVDELNSLQLEIPILQHMAQLNSKTGKSGDCMNGHNSDSTASVKSVQRMGGRGRVGDDSGRLNAVLITRSRMQSQVFGAGYSSLPSMTVEEFYRSRVADGTFQTPAQLAQAAAENQRISQTDEHHSRDDDISEQELKDALKERAEEEEDEHALSRARRWDEYNDTHKRGEGNRYNRS